MKPLSDVEPRTAINAANTPGDATSVYKITAPGSYYLTGNLGAASGKATVVIATSGAVTIDMMGFEIVAVAGATSAVLCSGSPASVDLRNGTVRGFAGAAVSCATSLSGRYQNLTVIGAGAASYVGLWTGPGSTVTGCTVQNVGNFGIGTGNNSVITGCTVTGALGDGISVGEGCVVSHCVARDCGNSGSESGFSLNKTSTIDHCTAKGCFYAGIVGASDADVTVSDCAISLCAVGIQVTRNCVVANNNLIENGIAINVTDSRSRVDGNHVFSSTGVGIKADTTFGCTVTRNVVQIQSGGSPYQVGVNNYVGAIVTLSATISGSNALANFKD
jgi:hypothetical protein